nr:hypothetical protein [uncultured Duganella sp.]
MSELSTTPSTNPHNAKYPEIITETETDEREESTEEQKLVYESGAPRGTSVIKKVTVSKIKIRTTTPYLGTV